VLFEDFYKEKGEFFNLELTLGRISSALKESNFNEKKLGNIIHIAGTNGKGSTAYFINQLLEKQDAKVALFTSPHIVDITERIQFDNHHINRKKFDELFNNYVEIIEQNKLSYFETITFIALKFFESKTPEFTILETGLGGKYDATNVLENKTPVITRIAQDHINYLGKNIYDIIDEKFAIIKNNSEIFVGYNTDFINEYIKNKYSNVDVHFITQNDLISNKYPIPYNENISLAYKVVSKFYKKIDCDKLNLPFCRFEKINNVIFDGAHNSNGLLRLVTNFDNKVDIVCSFTEEKNIDNFINILSRIAKNIYLTEIPDNMRSINLDSINIPNVIKIKNPIEALNKAIENNKETDILVTGSLYLCAFLRKYLKG
jgi:dihydrofolate synthase/folylpolyglutamate synthase